MANQTYEKLSHKDHVLHRPDMYIGDIEQLEDTFYCFNEESKTMEKKPIQYIPGEFKLFDEIIVNAYDQYIRLKESNDSTLLKVKTIKINIDKESGKISVYNDGEGIPVKIHEKEKKYIPELIFGELLTSSNYSGTKKKHTGGKNGYGAKLANLFSDEFSLITVDKINQKKFSLTWTNNMKNKGKPSIKSCKSKPYTEISYIPDFKRFNSSGLTEDMFQLMKRRAYDLSACAGSDINVYFNDEKIDIKSFDKYMNYFVGSTKKVFEKVNERWEVGVVLSPSLTFEQISFVNGINTMKGGKHVDYITNQICKNLSAYVEKKKKIVLKQNFIKENIMIFIKCVIDDPNFGSQTKETLTTNKSKFGSTCELSPKFIENLSKLGIVEKALALMEAKQNKTMKKTDGKKKNKITGIPKLEDANWAGTKKSNQCTLILTEGDSAKSTAMSGLEIIGRDKYGVFPLKGKPINVKDENNLKKLLQNEEIANIKKIIGLETGKEYKEIDELRYGKILILTDQDEDGSHIKGLIFTLFETLWPSLYKMSGFLNSMLTPIVKAKHAKDVKEFYSLKDYENFSETHKELMRKYHVKYYKGLATSTPKEAKEYFRQLKLVEYSTETKSDYDALNLAFAKEKESANKRKDWLSSYDRNLTLDYSKKSVPIKEFINKDLIHFSNSDNVRSLPNMVDGFKPSQRKVLFGCLKRNLVENEIKVAQLAGYVSEHSAYHHGEASLCGTIVNMAQNFVGSNNINLLDGVGQFGTRVLGGKDAGQPRYIFTKLEKIALQLFNPEDTPLLKNIYDDGMKVEPEYYVPTLPMILVNGASGIGTGWSSSVPCYNPVDIVNNIRLYLFKKPMKPMTPWYKGFTGTITKQDNDRFITRGKYHIKGSNKVIITELPVGKWTQKFQEDLEKMITGESKKKHNVRNYNSYCTDVKIHYEIQVESTEGHDFEKMFDLTSTISTSNMVLYNADFKLKKYNDPLEIIEDYMKVRKAFYKKRIQHNLGVIEEDLLILENKMKFIKEFIIGTIKIIKIKKNEIIKQLETKSYHKVSETYDYLIKMPIYNLSQEKLDELQEKIDKKKQEQEVLLKETSNTLYLKELDSFKL